MRWGESIQVVGLQCACKVTITRVRSSVNFGSYLVLVFRRKCILVLVTFSHFYPPFSLVFVDENSEHFSLVLVDEVLLHFSLVLVTFKSPSQSHIKLLSFPSQAQGPLVLCLQLHNSQACST